MPDVSVFNLEGTDISVKDSTARGNIATLNTDVGSLASRVTALEGLSRLSVTYNQSSEKISFTTQS
jgi:hypothetical protein